MESAIDVINRLNGKSVEQEFAEAIVDGKVELLGIDEIVTRLGVSRSTLERWVRNGRHDLLHVSVRASRTEFPNPDIYIGSSPKWSKNTVVKWLMSNSSK